MSARAATYAGIGWVACASVWGWFEAGRIRVRTVEIASARVPAGTAPVRLVQISDVHAGYTCRRGVFRKILRAVRAADPDILVSTGDMVDGHPPSLNAMADELAGVEAPAGKFAVVGNHEVYPGLGPSLAFHERAGFRMLRGTCAAVGGIRLCGVDDPAVQREAGSPVVSEEAALSGGSDGSLFTVLLKHRPEAGAGRELADLQLSGHIHGGQIFPFGLITGAVYGQPVSRLVATGGRLSLYISPGSGTWGPPFRVLAPPEVTLFLIGPED